MKEFKKLKGCKNIVIFGYSTVGQSIYYKLIKEDFQDHIFFCDNSRKKQGTASEHEVLSVEEAVKRIPDGVFILTSKVYSGIMEEQLISAGVLPDNIVTFPELEESGIITGIEKKYHVMDEIQFEIDIASHCNLDCKCCSQFSPISKEIYINPEEMERDFHRLSDLFEGKAKRIYLIGGEPLLHPDIIGCMKIARKYFHTGDIDLFTNGLLLQKQNEDFWETCRAQNIKIIVTKYPINADYEGMKELAQRNHIDFTFYGASEDYKYMVSLGLDAEGKQDIEESFSYCTEGNNCVKLSKGRIYTCTRPAAIWKFNEFFQANFEVSNEDSIDIYQASSGREILEFISKPIPFCRYCNLRGERTVYEWGRSEKKREEWI